MDSLRFKGLRTCCIGICFFGSLWHGIAMEFVFLGMGIGHGMEHEIWDCMEF